MEKVILTHIEFARTIFKASGNCPGGTKKEDFFLRKEGSEKILDIEDVEISDGKFSLEIAVLAANDEAPLTSGSWFICVKNSDGTFKNCFVTDFLYDRIYQYEESEVHLDVLADKGPNNYFHVYSRLREGDFAFFLFVEYVVPKKINGVFRIWKQNLARRHRARMRYIRKKLFAAAFKFFNRAVRKTGRRVLFTSESRSGIGGNEKFIYDKMLERGMDKDYEFRFDFKPSIKSRRSFKSKVLFTYYLATSDYIFVDDYQPEIYLNEYSPEVKIIQVWHACGAFKTVGFERLGAKGAPAFDTRTHKCYTHVLVSSQHSAKHNAEAFAISRSRFYPTGVPRTDIFFDEKYKRDAEERMRREFPRVKSAKKVILYAPTFRGKNARDAFFPMQVLHFEKIGEYLKNTDSVMIVKMHPFIKEHLAIPEGYENYFIDASAYREVNDMLFITDLLVTDYSSVIYEASLLDIPMLFYAFDLKQYIEERGFYEPYEDIVPGKIVRNLQSFIKALEEEDYESEKLKGFVEKNFKYTDGKSTDRAIDLIFGKKQA